MNGWPPASSMSKMVQIIGVIQGRGRAGLTLETLQGWTVGEIILRHELERHAAAQTSPSRSMWTIL